MSPAKHESDQGYCSTSTLNDIQKVQVIKERTAYFMLCVHARSGALAWRWRAHT